MVSDTIGHISLFKLLIISAKIHDMHLQGDPIMLILFNIFCRATCDRPGKECKIFQKHVILTHTWLRPRKKYMAEVAISSLG